MKLPTVAVCLGIGALAACRSQPVPPATPAPRDGTVVAASSGRTWDAVMDAFAERGISIASADRSAGLIVPTGRTIVSRQERFDALRYTDCGADEVGERIWPEFVKYNVVVHGDSTSSRVLVRAFYEPMISASTYFGRCESRGVYESALEDSIKTRAERPR